MFIGSRQMFAIPCPHCRQTEGHKPGCPAVALEELRSRQKWLGCPVCSQNQVDRNDEDLWECRCCRSQFVNQVPEVVETTGQAFTIIDFKADQSHQVLLAKEAGSGKFSIDAAIAKLEQKMRRRRRKK